MSYFDNMSKTVPLNLLAVFEAVATERNVSRAAERLNVSQSAVSHALNRLRDVIGDELFVRSSRGVQPTARALELAHRISPLLTQLRAALQPLAFDPLQSSHNFRIILSDYSAALMFSKLAADLISAGSDLTLTASVQPIRQALKSLDRNDAEFFIAPFRPPSEYSSLDLFENGAPMVIMDKGNPMARGELTLERYAAARHVYIPIDGTGAASGSIEEALLKHGLTRRFAVTVNQYAAGPPLILGTDLVMLSPSKMAAVSAARYGLHTVPLALDQPPLITRLIWRQHFASRGADDWFRDFIQRCAINWPLAAN